MSTRNYRVIEVPSEYNPDKVHVFRIYPDSHITYNQKICGKIFYRRFERCGKNHGYRDVLDKVLLQKNWAMVMDGRIIERFETQEQAEKDGKSFSELLSEVKDKYNFKNTDYKVYKIGGTL